MINRFVFDRYLSDEEKYKIIRVTEDSTESIPLYKLVEAYNIVVMTPQHLVNLHR